MLKIQPYWSRRKTAAGFAWKINVRIVGANNRKIWADPQGYDKKADALAAIDLLSVAFAGCAARDNLHNAIHQSGPGEVSGRAGFVIESLPPRPKKTL